jgi:hypothetical protein
MKNIFFLFFKNPLHLHVGNLQFNKFLHFLYLNFEGEFSSVGQVFENYKSSQNCTTAQVMHTLLTEMVWATFWAIFSQTHLVTLLSTQYWLQVQMWLRNVAPTSTPTNVHMYVCTYVHTCLCLFSGDQCSLSK